mgnify:FL=1
MAIGKLEKEIEKIWNRLKDEPEKGWVKSEKKYFQDKAAETIYNPDLATFTASSLDIIDKNWPKEGWPTQVSKLKSYYGIGPSVSKSTRGTNANENRNMGEKQHWWEKTNAHISEDNKYYVVPVLFKNITSNKHLIDYKGPDGKYKIGSPSEEGTLLHKETEFSDLCKKVALKKLKKDLHKAMSNKQIEDWYKQYAIIPSDINVPRSVNPQTNQPDIVTITNSWRIVPRKPEYQNLFVKVLFDKGWVDSLPPEVDPTIDYANTNREVLILLKDLKQYLTNMTTILYHFDTQMHNAWIENGVESSFQGKCVSEQIGKIYGILSDLMVKNGKAPLEPVFVSKSLDMSENGAFQFGFTKDYDLQYIAFSDVADCLCEEDVNMNAYALREGLLEMKMAGPFANRTVNNFIHKLPDINRRYSKYIKGVDKVNNDLFGTQQSYLKFINTYVYPTPETSFQGAGEATNFEKMWLGTMATFDELKNPLWKDALFTGKYVKDPLQLMSPEVKNMIVGASNATYITTGDSVMMKALTDDLKSITALYDKLLHKIPISELLKVAGRIIFQCLGPDVRRKICKVILKTIPIGELRMVLYPCLRNVENGDLAIAKLEEMVTGRTGEVYKIASSRYPDKFPANADQWTQAQALASMTSMYCSDPYMQKKLGRSPDDFNDELAAWADTEATDAICSCVIQLYGPIGEILEQAQEVADDVIDGMMSSSKKKAYNLERETTLAIDRMLNPIKRYLDGGNMMKDLADAFAKGLQDMAMSLVYATVMVLIKYVKDQVLGSLTRDLCNSPNGSPFGFTGPGDWLRNSTIYKDKDQQQVWDVMKNFEAKHFFNADIQGAFDTSRWDKLSFAFSPSEFKRMFANPCADTSFTKELEIVSDIFTPDKTKAEMEENFPGESVDAIAAQVGYDPTRKNQFYNHDGTTVNLEGLITTNQARDFMVEVGSHIDPNIIEDAQAQYHQYSNAWAELCLPGIPEELSKTIDPEDIKKIILSDEEDLGKDFEKIMALLEPEMMKNKYPPLFCGPCAPNQVGMKPIMDSQTHPSQLFMHQRLNDHTYQIIDDVFNNNLSAYKPIINEVGDMGIINTLISKIPSNEEIDPKQAASKYGEFFGEMLQSVGTDPKYQNTPNKSVAEKLKNTISKITADNNFLGQIYTYNPDKGIAVFNYDIPNSSIELFLVINLSNESYNFRGDVTITPPQIKLISYNAGMKEYSFPHDDAPMEDYNEDDVGFELFDYWTENPSGNQSEIVPTMMAKGLLEGTSQSIFNAVYPLAVSLMLETVWNNTTHNELFLSKNFNAMPLTNEEVKSKCAETSITPLLDPEGTKQDIDDMRKVLECVTSMFAKPDALQIANLFGLYKSLIKVCVTEEILKVFFMYSFAKLSDIIESDHYMRLLVDNVKNSVESVVASGFEQLKEYCSKLVNARLKLVDESELENKTEQEKAEFLRTKDPDESLNMIITECALEVDKLFDTRVRDHINDEWKNLFMSLDDIDSKDPQSYLKNNLFQYAINPRMMMDSKYPARKYIYSNGNGPATLGYQLESGKLPSFELASDNLDAYHYGYPEQIYRPLPVNTFGGLYFEPYVRMTSKLEINDYQAHPAGSGENVPKDNMLTIWQDGEAVQVVEKVSSILSESEQAYFKIFWSRFKSAYAHWDKATFRDTLDTNIKEASAHSGEREVFDNLNSNGQTKDLWLRNTDVGSNQQDPNASWPRGAGTAFYQTKHGIGDTETVKHIHQFLGSLIDKIDAEMHDHNVLVFWRADDTRSTFLEFFDLFFSVCNILGTPYDVAPDDESSAHGLKNSMKAYIDQRSIFTNIVSSYKFNHPSPDTTNSYAGKGTFGYANITGDEGWADAYYYWQHYPYGVIPSARIHFLNRGVINFNTFYKSYWGLANNFEKMKKNNATLSNARGTDDWQSTSTIDLFANSKNTIFGIGDTIDAGVDIPTWESMSDSAKAEWLKKYEETGNIEYLFKAQDGYGYWKGSDFLNNSNINSREFMLSIQDFLVKHDFPDMEPADLSSDGGSFTAAWKGMLVDNALSKNAKHICSFYNWLRSIFIESPFDEWFDFNLGMRLNLVIPYEDNTNLKDYVSQYIKNNIDSLTGFDNLPDELKEVAKNDRNYNLDKVFLLSQPKPGSPIEDISGIRWLCLPLEVVEYNLRDYWQEIHEKYGVSEIGKTRPGHIIASKIKEAEKKTNGKYDSTVPDSPWHIIMKNIVELGFGNIQDPGVGYKYDFCRGGDKGLEVAGALQQNFFKNVHAPMKIDTSLMTPHKTTEKYYVSDVDESNIMRPTLWSACRLIQTALAQGLRTGATSTEPNPIRKEVLDRLKFELLNKVIKDNNKYLNELLPVEEAVFTTAMVYRYSIVSAYPSLQDLFLPTKKLINSFIVQMLKTIEGDYTYVNEVLEGMDSQEKLNTSSPSPDSIAKIFFELIVQMAANTVDPTWKTPWFMPGPLTPIGAIAKGISMDWGKDGKKEEKETLAGDECEDKEAAETEA